MSMPATARLLDLADEAHSSGVGFIAITKAEADELLRETESLGQPIPKASMANEWECAGFRIVTNG